MSVHALVISSFSLVFLILAFVFLPSRLFVISLSFPLVVRLGCLPVFVSSLPFCLSLLLDFPLRPANCVVPSGWCSCPFLPFSFLSRAVHLLRLLLVLVSRFASSTNFEKFRVILALVRVMFCLGRWFQLATVLHRHRGIASRSRPAFGSKKVTEGRGTTVLSATSVSWIFPLVVAALHHGADRVERWEENSSS